MNLNCCKKGKRSGKEEEGNPKIFLVKEKEIKKQELDKLEFKTNRKQRSRNCKCNNSTTFLILSEKKKY